VKPFEYLSPLDVPDAVQTLRERGQDACVIAGGQSLLLALKQRELTPGCLVSVGAIPELRGVAAADDGTLRIGATTTYAQLERAGLAGWHREVGAVAGNLADRPVRTMGTVGGAICQADPRFDVPTLAVAVDATLEVASTDGVREVAAADALCNGGALRQPFDVLTAVSVPAQARFSGVAFEKFRMRVFDAATASVVCAVRVGTSGRLDEVRIAVGAVGPHPALAPASAASVVGMEPAAVQASDLGAAVAAEVTPLSDGATDLARYKHWLVASLARTAFTRATIPLGD
jgi:carbon-monoxide dehydrogenase medium subunit